MHDNNVSLRPVTADDESFLLEVYASTRALELALTGWEQSQQDAFIKMQFAAQQHHYRTAYAQGEHSIIILDGQPVGRVYTAEDGDVIRILDITLLPSWRNRGIGTPLILEVLSRALQASKPVQIYVENYNPSLRLFLRLGFSKIGDDGFNFLLEWRPQA